MIIRASDTDIVVICVYYAATLFKDLPELWVRTAPDAYLTVHEIAASLGLSLCRALPFMHSRGGRNATSYSFFTGKKALLNCSKTTDIRVLEDFGKSNQNQLTTDVINQARDLVVAAYANNADEFQELDLAKLRAHKFLNNRSTLLKLLPNTEGAFLYHLKRAALATATDKNAHVGKPQIPPQYENYDWALKDGKLVPVTTTQPAWPQSKSKVIAFGCTRGCEKNCSCSKKNITCYIGCRCQGTAEKCSRVQHTVALCSSESSESDSDKRWVLYRVTTGEFIAHVIVLFSVVSPGRSVRSLANLPR